MTNAALGHLAIRHSTIRHSLVIGHWSLVILSSRGWPCERPLPLPRRSPPPPATSTSRADGGAAPVDHLRRAGLLYHLAPHGVSRRRTGSQHARRRYGRLPAHEA